MKLAKILVLLFMTISLVNCGSDDDSGPVFELTNENITGTFAMTAFDEERETTVTVLDVTAPFSNSSTIGDTFTNVELSFTAEGTYSITGQYRESTITDLVGSSTDEITSSIVTLNDNGTYTIDLEEDLLTLVSSNEGGFDGVYEVDTFTEELLLVTLNTSVVTSQSEMTIERNIRFEKN